MFCKGCLTFTSRSTWVASAPRAGRHDPGCLATELEPDSELARVFDGDEGGGADAHGDYIDGVVADAFGDGGMGVSSGAHGGAGF